VEIGSAARLKEFQGQLTAHVEVPLPPEQIFKHVLQATGKTWHTPEGHRWKIRQARMGHGQFRLQIEATIPRPDVNKEMIMQTEQTLYELQPGGSWEPIGLEAGRLAVLDGRGRPCKLLDIEGHRANYHENGIVQHMTFTFHTHWGLFKPARLLYRGRRTFAIDVPFAFKDVPLP
jgi:hypothetical protein